MSSIGVCRMALLSGFVFSACLYGQVNGRLSGSVLDSSGAPIPAATVTLTLSGGAKAALQSETTSEGLFSFTGVRPETYDVSVESKGFTRQVTRGIVVLPGREAAVPVVHLEIGSIAETVEVSSTAEAVQIANAENSVSLSNAEVRKLPVINRSPLSLIGTQAGVSYNGRSTGNTVINGQRGSFANVTLDGINVQDNYLRTNGLDFLPNLLLLDQVSEITVVTSNAGASAFGGSAQIVFNTPSGTNQFHGGLIWANRNNAYAANTWFNNRDGIKLPFLNQNQLGGHIGGPIFKDKLFFYSNYEAFRLRQQSSQNRTILTADARNGIYSYLDTAGVLRKVNILQAAGVSADPAMQKLLALVPGPEKINNFRLGDSRDDLRRNTGGYSFLARNNRTRDNVTGKLDYNLSTRHVFTGTYAWNKDIVDRPASSTSNDYSLIPKVTNDDTSNLMSTGWRWSPTSTLTNELRGGFNLAPAVFASTEQFGSAIFTGMTYSNPVNTFRSQGRNTNTYNIRDDGNYIRGRHTIQFGFLFQGIRVAPYNDAGITPSYTIGIGTGNTGLSTQQLPGIGATDLNAANLLLATLAGYYTSYTQTFNVTSRTSGFVNGATQLRHETLNNYAFYGQDNFKLRPGLSLTVGLRWDYYSPMDETDSLFLLPVLKDQNPINTLLSNSSLDFAGASSGRPWYRSDKNNFAPNIGLAWDVFGNGKTALRAGYSVNFVNDEMIAALENSAATNSGLTQTPTRAGLTGTVSGGLTPVPTPAFQVPRTFQDNYNLSTTTAFGIPDPNLRTPYVQQYTFGIQHEIKGTIIEARYVGNHATKQFRAIDYNQVLVKGPFLQDFQKAANNGNLALAATGTFNPAYSAAIPGSQPLPFFDKLSSGGLLTNATIRNLIQTGQPGELANTYQTSRLNGSVDFYRNPLALGLNMMTNYSNSNYNALQIDVRRRTSRGLFLQANYTYSKVLSDSVGESSFRFEAFLDKDNPAIERARAPFDLTHAIKALGTYELPIGRGHALNYRPLNYLLSGWTTGAIVTLQSGAPFSVLSTRATLNRTARSTLNTADTSLTKGQLDDLFQFRQTPQGPYFVAASAIGSDTRAVAADGRPAFAGQVFFNPQAGSLGGLQRRMFSGPWGFNTDFSLLKSTKITERQSVELRMNATNIFNHPTWVVDDQTITSANFGQITGSLFGRRLIEFSLSYRF